MACKYIHESPLTTPSLLGLICSGNERSIILFYMWIYRRKSRNQGPVSENTVKKGRDLQRKSSEEYYLKLVNQRKSRKGHFFLDIEKSTVRYLGTKLVEIRACFHFV